MAGDWIKMRSNLHEHPKVATISQKLGLDELHVVGMLWRIWSWADQHSRDGHGISVTLVTVDRLARHDGFGQAMSEVGWLEASDTGITLPHFAKHNGHTAKERVLAAERKALQRNREQQQHDGVTKKSRANRDKPVTTEENRTEEKREEIQTAAPAVRPEKEADQTPIPAGFSQAFTDLWAEYVTYRRDRKLKPLLPVSVRAQFKKFDEWGEAKASEAIRDAIRNNWQGIFEPRVQAIRPGMKPQPEKKPFTIADLIRDKMPPAQ